MKNSLLSFVLSLVCLLGFQQAAAAFKDIKVDLTNANLLTAEEKADKSLGA